MALPIPTQRYTQRIIILLVTVSIIVHIYTTASLATTQVDSRHLHWSDRTWKAATETAKKLLPINQSNAASGVEQEAKQILLTESDHERMNATFISLARNSDLQGMLHSIRDVEDRFNRNWHYDWIFLNDEDFDEEFIQQTSALISGRAMFGKVDEEQWSFPEHIDQDKAELAREEMKNVWYGDSVSYRHMCRYQSGFFYRHPLVLGFEWYWRVEPSISLSCNIRNDPFRWMAEHGKKYGFAISLNELADTVPSLWNHTKGFMEAHPQHIVEDSHLKFLSEDGGETWNHCHFWSNFEIVNLDWFRSKAYGDFFDYLDRAGGFFYERWGDASVHSIAAALMLKKGEIHFFDDIGYHHHPLLNCPRSPQKRIDQSCSCNVEDNMDWSPSCTKRFFEVAGIPFPVGYDRDVPPEVGL